MSLFGRKKRDVVPATQVAVPPPRPVDLTDADKMHAFVTIHRSEDEWETFDKTVRRLHHFPQDHDRALLRRLLDADAAARGTAQQALDRLQRSGENEQMSALRKELEEWHAESAERTRRVKVWLF